MTELDKLEIYLKENGIRYERLDERPNIPKSQQNLLKKIGIDYHQIVVPSFGKGYGWEWDAICHKGSYGYEEGLLEIMGCIVPDDVEDRVEGYLTAEDVIERIENYDKKRIRK